MAGPPRAPYDPWKDVDGVHIPVACRVQQIAVAKEHGALSSRLHQRGEVVDRRGSRLVVLFDGEDKPVTIRPHLVRVLAKDVW